MYDRVERDHIVRSKISTTRCFDHGRCVQFNATCSRTINRSIESNQAINQSIESILKLSRSARTSRLGPRTRSKSALSVHLTSCTQKCQISSTRHCGHGRGSCCVRGRRRTACPFWAHRAVDAWIAASWCARIADPSRVSPCRAG